MAQIKNRHAHGQRDSQNRSAHVRQSHQARTLHYARHLRMCLVRQKYGISLSVSGGTHHGFADHGEGFCVFNDVCVASNLLLARGQAKRILSVDLDVHQGNGNASIMANNPAVFVFSIHGKKNYPFINPHLT